MGFNCLKARATTFQEIPLYQPWKDEKAESTLEPPSGFGHMTPTLGFQHLKH